MFEGALVDSQKSLTEERRNRVRENDLRTDRRIYRQTDNGRNMKVLRHCNISKNPIPGKVYEMNLQVRSIAYFAI